MVHQDDTSERDITGRYKITSSDGVKGELTLTNGGEFWLLLGGRMNASAEGKWLLDGDELRLTVIPPPADETHDPDDFDYDVRLGSNLYLGHSLQTLEPLDVETIIIHRNGDMLELKTDLLMDEPRIARLAEGERSGAVQTVVRVGPPAPEFYTQFVQDDLQRMYPYVVPGTWIEAAAPEAVVTWPFSDDLHMILMLDLQGMLRNVRPEDLDAIGCTPDEAFSVAAENLAAAYHSNAFTWGEMTLDDGLRIACAMDNWIAPASALIIGNFYQMLVENFGQTRFAAVVPNQQTLIAFPINDETLSSASLQEFIETEFNNHHKPVSRSWLVLDGEWPSAFANGDLE